jgi:hypothetical protein
MRVTISVQLKALHNERRVVVTSEDVSERGTVYSASLPVKAE